MIRRSLQARRSLSGTSGACAPWASSGVVQVHAIHQDVPFTRAVSAAVDHEIRDLVRWLGLELALLGLGRHFRRVCTFPSNRSPLPQAAFFMKSLI
jgi:hypothetical protein